MSLKTFLILKSKNEVCYVGGLSEIRGIYELVESFNYLDSMKLNLGGSLIIQILKEKVFKIMV